MLEIWSSREVGSGVVGGGPKSNGQAPHARYRMAAAQLLPSNLALRHHTLCQNRERKAPMVTLL